MQGMKYTSSNTVENTPLFINGHFTHIPKLCDTKAPEWWTEYVDEVVKSICVCWYSRTGSTGEEKSPLLYKQKSQYDNWNTSKCNLHADSYLNWSISLPKMAN